MSYTVQDDKIMIRSDETKNYKTEKIEGTVYNSHHSWLQLVLKKQEKAWKFPYFFPVAAEFVNTLKACPTWKGNTRSSRGLIYHVTTVWTSLPLDMLIWWLFSLETREGWWVAATVELTCWTSTLTEWPVSKHRCVFTLLMTQERLNLQMLDDMCLIQEFTDEITRRSFRRSIIYEPRICKS